MQEGSKKRRTSPQPEDASLQDPQSLRELVENLHEGIYVTNRDGEILDANPAFLEMVGVASIEEARALSAAEFLVDAAERERELASLRVLGFTRGEISLILLGELAILTLLALPVGALIGYGLGQVIMTAFNNEVYRLSFVASPATIAWSFLIVIAAAGVSGLLVRRRLDRLDLVAVLKTRE